MDHKKFIKMDHKKFIKNILKFEKSKNSYLK